VAEQVVGIRLRVYDFHLRQGSGGQDGGQGSSGQPPSRIRLPPSPRLPPTRIRYGGQDGGQDGGQGSSGQPASLGLRRARVAVGNEIVRSTAFRRNLDAHETLLPSRQSPDGTPNGRGSCGRDGEGDSSSGVTAELRTGERTSCRAVDLRRRVQSVFKRVGKPVLLFDA
jgi:hypothetical protein